MCPRPVPDRMSDAVKSYVERLASMMFKTLEQHPDQPFATEERFSKDDHACIVSALHGTLGHRVFLCGEPTENPAPIVGRLFGPRSASCVVINFAYELQAKRQVEPPAPCPEPLQRTLEKLEAGLFIPGRAFTVVVIPTPEEWAAVQLLRARGARVRFFFGRPPAAFPSAVVVLCERH